MNKSVCGECLDVVFTFMLRLEKLHFSGALVLSLRNVLEGWMDDVEERRS